MLPIARHHRLVIPHRLALIAAAVCLVLSFTVDRADTDGQLRAEHGNRIERINTGDGGSDAISQSERSRSSRQGSRLRLLPWFSGLMHW